MGGNGYCSGMGGLGPHGCGHNDAMVSGVGGGLLGSNGEPWLGLEAISGCPQLRVAGSLMPQWWENV